MEFFFGNVSPFMATFILNSASGSFFLTSDVQFSLTVYAQIGKTQTSWKIA